MNCCDDYGQCTQGDNCPARAFNDVVTHGMGITRGGQRIDPKDVWPFPAAPLPNDRTTPPFNPNNFEDAPL